MAQAADVAASYREAMVDRLVSKSVGAAERAGADGGRRRRRGRELAATAAVVAEGESAGFTSWSPPFAYCTDNAAMIGAAALAGPRLRVS